MARAPASAEDYGWVEIPQPEHGAVARMHHVGGNPADLEHAGVYFAVRGDMSCTGISLTGSSSTTS